MDRRPFHDDASTSLHCYYNEYSPAPNALDFVHLVSRLILSLVLVAATPFGFEY